MVSVVSRRGQFPSGLEGRVDPAPPRAASNPSSGALDPLLNEGPPTGAPRPSLRLGGGNGALVWRQTAQLTSARSALVHAGKITWGNRLFLVSISCHASFNPCSENLSTSSEPAPCWPVWLLSASRKPPGWPRWILSASTDGFATDACSFRTVCPRHSCWRTATQLGKITVTVGLT